MSLFGRQTWPVVPAVPEVVSTSNQAPEVAFVRTVLVQPDNSAAMTAAATFLHTAQKVLGPRILSVEEKAVTTRGMLNHIRTAASDAKTKIHVRCTLGHLTELEVHVEIIVVV